MKKRRLGELNRGNKFMHMQGITGHVYNAGSAYKLNV